MDATVTPFGVVAAGSKPLTNPASQRANNHPAPKSAGQRGCRTPRMWITSSASAFRALPCGSGRPRASWLTRGIAEAPPAHVSSYLSPKQRRGSLR